MAVTILAIGIGANTAIFSLLDAALLRPLAVRDADRLVEVAYGDRVIDHPYPVWNDIRARHLFAGAFAWTFDRFNTAPGGPVAYVDGVWASGEMFDVLGVHAILGRTLTEADDRPGGGSSGAVAVISYQFWQRRYGGDPATVGRTITMIGCHSPSSGSCQPRSGLDVGLPFRRGASNRRGRAHGNAGDQSPQSVRVYADIMFRLRTGQAVESASAELRALQPAIRAATMPDYRYSKDRDAYLREPLSVHAAPNGQLFLQARYERPLEALLALVGIVLLVGCTNVATLLLARTTARSHELSRACARRSEPRAAVSPVKCSSKARSSAAWERSPACSSLVCSAVCWPRRCQPRPTRSHSISLRTGASSRSPLGCSVLTVVLFGTAPALRAARAGPIDALKPGIASASGERFGHDAPLVVAQVALSLVLVAGGVLLIRTFAALARIRPGFDRDRVLVVGVTRSRKDLAPGQLPALYQEVTDASWRHWPVSSAR